jgi:hypothetical protein
MRLNNAVVPAREAFAYNMFKLEPTKSVAAVNDALAADEKLGPCKLALSRIYPIRDAAVAGLPLPARVSKKKAKAVETTTPEATVTVETADCPDRPEATAEVVTCVAEFPRPKDTEQSFSPVCEADPSAEVATTFK